MSQVLELPDDLHAAAEGLTSTDWISMRLATSAAHANPPSAASAPQSLADLFAGQVGHIESGGQGDLSEDTGRAFGEYLEAKKRAGHL